MATGAGERFLQSADAMADDNMPRQPRSMPSLGTMMHPDIGLAGSLCGPGAFRRQFKTKGESRKGHRRESSEGAPPALGTIKSGEVCAPRPIDISDHPSLQVVQLVA